MIFFLGGPIFRDLRRPTRFGGGGGVVAEIFRDRRKPGRFSGGGVVAEIVWASPVRGEGVVGEFFFLTGGQDQSSDLNSGNFLRHFRVTSRLPEINCGKKTVYPKFGGGHGPPGPPWLRHYVLSDLSTMIIHPLTPIS